MSSQFWAVYRADALWCVTIVVIVAFGKIGYYYFRRWRAKRRVERELRYVAPELREERRAELEGRVAVGLQPTKFYAGIVGDGEQPRELPHYRCPHCLHRIEVFVLPGLELPKAGTSRPSDSEDQLG